jgi:hypothetical protein
MPRKYIHADIESTLPIEAIWRRVSDCTTWTEWGPYHEAELLTEGDPDRFGVGSTRRLKKGKTEVTEEITGFDPPNYVSYTLLSGLPLKQYHGEVTLTPTDTGTHIRWLSHFHAPFGTGWLYAWALQKFLRQLLGDLALEQAPTKHP